jgi:hypothetical protein
MADKNFILSGRNTIIHKIRKMDLLIINGGAPVVKVAYDGLSIYDGPIPRNRSEAKKAYLDIVDTSAMDIFGETKTLIFIQALDNKEYKIDYSKVNTPNFIKIHQESYI